MDTTTREDTTMDTTADTIKAALTRAELKSAIRDMAVSIRDAGPRNTLTFADLDQAQRAAKLFIQAGIRCTFEGDRQPILHTAADFFPKDAPKAVTEMSTPELVREFADTRVWFAQHEVTGRHPAGTRLHARLKDVVDQLRERHVLD